MGTVLGEKKKVGQTRTQLRIPKKQLFALSIKDP
jgi:hypothetical protein